MTKYTLYVGLNDKDTTTQLIGTLDAYRVISNIIETDSTVKECKGVYTHKDGTITTENTLEVVILDVDGSLGRDWIINKIKGIKKALNQESVALQTEDVNSELIY